MSYRDEMLHRKRLLKRILLAVVSAATLVAALVYAGPISSLRELYSIDARWIVAALGILVVATGLAALRFLLVLRAFGYRPETRALLLSFFIGQVSHIFLLNVVGQSVTRAALLASAGVPRSVTVAATFAERILAAALLFIFSVAASVFLLGGLEIDWQAGGVNFAWLMTGLCVAALAASVAIARYIGIDTPVRRGIRAILRFWPSAVVTLVVQALTLCVWMAVFLGISDLKLSLAVVGAFLVAMFASKLPISFGGWGLRELSAGYALGLVGVASSVGVATAIIMGLLSLVVVLVAGGLAVGFLRGRRDIVPTDAGGRTSSNQMEFARFLPMLGVLTVSVLLYFQVRVPTDSGAITANLADLGAVTAGGLLVVQLLVNRNFGPIPKPFVIWLAGLTSVIVMGLIVGYMNYGLNEWAIWNRGVGWLVLLGYIAAGSAVVYAGSWSQLRVIFGGFIAAGFAITVLIILAFIVEVITGWLSGIAIVPIRAFSANPNAYVVLLTGVMAVVVAAYRAHLYSSRAVLLISAVAIIGAGMYLTFSRTGYGMFVLALLLILATSGRGQWWADTSRIVAGLAIAILIVGLVYWIPDVVQLIRDGLGGNTAQGAAGSNAVRMLDTGHKGAGEADNLRWQSWVEGWELWLANPVLGSGLGAQVERYRSIGEFPLVIHNTPLWLLAETGLVGLAVALTGLFAVVIWVWQAQRDPVRAPWALGAGIMVVCVAGGSMFHDYAYQRIFWFLLAMFLALGMGRSPGSGQLAVSRSPDLTDPGTDQDGEPAVRG